MSKAVLHMKTIASKIGSKRMAVFEALAANHSNGMTLPALAAASGVPRSTVPRIVADFENRGLVVEVGRKGKAPIFRLNHRDLETIEVARACTFYTYRATTGEYPPAPPTLDVPIQSVSIGNLFQQVHFSGETAAR